MSKITELVSVVLPAYNEAETIVKSIDCYKAHSSVAEVIVVANGCTDETAVLAKKTGAIVIESKIKGKGSALKIGATIAKSAICVCIDSDCLNPSIQTITKLLKKSPSERRLVKGTFNRELHPGLVTEILVKPLFRLIGHPFSRLSQPLSGVFACDTEWLKSIDISLGFGVDLEILLVAEAQGMEIIETDIGKFEHKQRDIMHYSMMSYSIMEILKKHAII